MFDKFKTFAASAAVALASLPAVVLAQESSDAGTPITIPTIVDTSQLQSSLITTLTPWIILGVTVAVGIFVVFLGWRALRKGSKTGVSG